MGDSLEIRAKRLAEDGVKLKENFAREKAEMRERRKQQNTIANRQKRTKKHKENIMNKTKEEKLAGVIEAFFDKLVEDTDNWAALSAKPKDNTDIMMRKRRMLLSLIKDEALLISKVAELRDLAREEDDRKQLKDTDSDENQKLIQKAQEKMKKAGLKAVI